MIAGSSSQAAPQLTALELAERNWHAGEQRISRAEGAGDVLAALQALAAVPDNGQGFWRKRDKKKCGEAHG